MNTLPCNSPWADETVCVCVRAHVCARKCMQVFFLSLYLRIYGLKKSQIFQTPMSFKYILKVRRWYPQIVFKRKREQSGAGYSVSPDWCTKSRLRGLSYSAVPVCFILQSSLQQGRSKRVRSHRDVTEFKLFSETCELEFICHADNCFETF